MLRLIIRKIKLFEKTWQVKHKEEQKKTQMKVKRTSLLTPKFSQKNFNLD